MRKPTSKEENVFKRLRGKKAMFHVTKTVLDKAIQDANAGLVNILKDTGIIDYDSIESGEKHYIYANYKKYTDPSILPIRIQVSCYRAKTRGDRRIWFKGIKELSAADDMMALSIHKDKILLTNLTQ